MVKLVITGWIEDETQPFSNIPINCPNCGHKLRYTNALTYCNIYLVWCPNYRCRWVETYELPEEVKKKE